jgi:hypothetical protein
MTTRLMRVPSLRGGWQTQPGRGAGDGRGLHRQPQRLLCPHVTDRVRGLTFVVLNTNARRPDPADRLVWEAGDAAQCDLWFPPKRIPLEYGSSTLLPVPVIVAAHSRFFTGRMLPARKTEDLLLGSWELVFQLGRVPRRLIWDNEPGIGRGGRLAAGVAAFTARWPRGSCSCGPTTRSSRASSSGATDSSRRRSCPATHSSRQWTSMPSSTIGCRSRTAGVRTIEARAVDLMELGRGCWRCRRSWRSWGGANGSSGS